ncbi:Cation efflux family, putative [Angomonas deanei]|uniref:Cation efflux family, putative n=1 Tax=Angomonas deanei TaxID=59799 RepID=A0A7G2CE02_9TRYP|nr:Cation efflux family, putative [Angomonas deanei]
MLRAALRRRLPFSIPMHTPARPHSHQCGGHGHSHDHGHSHGGGHTHSHGTVESFVQGEALRQCKLATAAGAFTNVFFAVTKLYYGTAGGSVALVADGFHAFTDLFADAVSYASISFANAAFPRCRFPFGIGRLETSGAVVVAAILLFGGIALLIQSFQVCWGQLLAVLAPVEAHDHDHGHSHTAGDHHGHSHFELTAKDDSGRDIIVWTMVVLAASSVVCKELLFHWTRRVGKKAGSRVVIANAYHHRADAWSGGVALVGVFGQYIGLAGVDGLAGIVVSLSICQIGYNLLKGSIMEFFDYQNSEDISQLRQRLQMFSPTVDNAGNQPVGDLTSVSVENKIEVHKVVPINVFLMRHGGNYVLHLTLIVNEAHTALPNFSLDRKDHTTRAVVYGGAGNFRRPASHEQLHHDTRGLSDTDGETKKDGGGDCPPPWGSDAKEEDGDKEAPSVEDVIDGDSEEDEFRRTIPPYIIGSGATINPSLERCLYGLMEFHHLPLTLTYDWEKRVVYVRHNAMHLSAECTRDVEAVASCFKCVVKQEEEA